MAGLSFAFFSGNSISGELNMFDSSISGEPCRTFSRKRDFADENTLMGNTSYGPGYNPEMRTLGVNPHIQKITSNILDRMIKDSPRK